MTNKFPIEELLAIYGHILDGMGVQLKSDRERLAQYAHNICSNEMCVVDDNIMMSMSVLQMLQKVTLTDNPDDVEEIVHTFQFDTNNPNFPKRNGLIETLKRTVMTMLIKKYMEMPVVIYSMIDQFIVDKHPEGQPEGVVEVKVHSKMDAFNIDAVNAEYQAYKEKQEH